MTRVERVKLFLLWPRENWAEFGEFGWPFFWKGGEERGIGAGLVGNILVCSGNSNNAGPVKGGKDGVNNMGVNRKYLDVLYEKKQSAIETIDRLRKEGSPSGYSDQEVNNAKILCTQVQKEIIDDLITRYIEISCE